jgi:hypothetical protein
MFQTRRHDNQHDVIQTPTCEFYKELDSMGDLEKETKDSVSEAVKIAKEEGFSNQEIEQLIRVYLKDSVPKEILDDWLKHN